MDQRRSKNGDTESSKPDKRSIDSSKSLEHVSNINAETIVYENSSPLVDDKSNFVLYDEYNNDDNEDNNDDKNNNNVDIIPKKSSLKKNSRRTSNKNPKLQKLRELYEQTNTRKVDPSRPPPPPIDDIDDDVQTIISGDDDDDEDKRKQRIVRDNFMKKQRKIQRRRRLMLSAFVIATVFSIACILRLVILNSNLGVAPSYHGEVAFYDAFTAFVSLSALAPIGFIVSYFRMHAVFGFLFILGSFYTITMSVKALSHASLGSSDDTLSGSMTVFLTKRVNRTSDIPTFYQKLQKSCECCGFNEIDRLKDWPSKTKRIDFPSSCCQDGSETTCTGLGRMFNVTRIPSGFVIIQNEKFMQDWTIGKGPHKLDVKPNFQLSHHQPLLNQDIVPELFQSFEKEMHEELKFVNHSKLPGNVIPSEILLKFDAFVEELIYSGQVFRGEWIYFRLFPTNVHHGEETPATTSPVSDKESTIQPTTTKLPESTTTRPKLSSTTTEPKNVDPNLFCSDKELNRSYPHPETCKRYFKCMKNGNATLGEILDCEKWLHFSSRLQRCTVPEFANCSERVQEYSEKDDFFYMADYRMQQDELFTYYVSRGISENILLDQVLWKNGCERDVQSKNSVDGLLTCSDLKTDNSLYDKFLLPESGKYFRWKRNLQSSADIKSFFQNGHFYILTWLYSLLPIITVLTLVCSILFVHFYTRMQSAVMKELTPLQSTDYAMLKINNVADIEKMDPVTRQAHEALFRKQ